MNKKNIIVVIVLILALFVFAFSRNYSSVPAEQPRSIVLTETGFSPEEIEIKTGDTVIFTTTTGRDFWPASDLHPTHGIYPEFDPRQPIEPNKSWSFKFDNAGEWRFHDHLNSLYTGKIKVSGGQSLNINTKDCSTSNNKINCWQELLNSTLETEGLPETFDLLAELYAQEPLFAKECHGLVHEIGEFTYGKFKLKEDFELTSKTSYCGYGFYHGFMETLLQTTGDIRQAQAFCRYVGEKLADETTDGEGACYHGIGHGAVDGGDPSAWGDFEKMLAPAMKMCLSVAGNDRSQYGKLYRCVTGAYNSIEILSMDAKYKLFEMQKDPFYICPSQPEEYKEGCYTNMLPALLRFTQNDLVESQKYVEKIPEPNFLDAKARITADLFHEFIRLNLNKADYNKITGINICQSLKSPYRIGCIDGLSGGHMKYGDPSNAYVKGLNFCASKELLDEEKGVCYKHILSRLRIWYSQSKSQAICQTAPEEFQKYCNF